jgi:hypothetical protein
MRVPDGHRVATYSVGALPAVGSTEAVAWLAHLGTGSDEAEQELDAILARVGELMAGARPRIVLSVEAGSLSSLMAPNDPRVLACPRGVLIWTVDADGLAGAPRGTSLVQRWLRCLYTTGTRGEPPAQQVFLHAARSPRARAFAALVHGLGIGVRVPEPRNGEIVAEVVRPEGVVISALLGTAPGAADPADEFALQINRAKDRAESDGDTELLKRLEAEERDALANKLAPAAGEPAVSAVRRAPRLRRLVLAVADAGDAAYPALYEELLRREAPLQVIIDPQTMGAALRSWPGGVQALPVYADEASLLMSARELGTQPGGVAGAVMPPPKLFGWAAEHSWAIAMNAFRAPGEPVYVIVTPEAVNALAQGRMPAIPAA